MYQIKLFLVFLIALVNAIIDPIFLDQPYTSGFIKWKENREMFYWHFESRQSSSTDPLVIWLSGGPGSSSLVNLFLENGPFKILDDLTFIENIHSWNNKANLVFVDQPLGTGFSNADEKIIPQTLEQVAADFWEFLTGFYEIHPQYRNRKLFIAGQSFAGIFIPSISCKIISMKQDFINLAGVMIGNGLVNAFWQFPEYLPFAYEQKIINKNQFNMLVNLFERCQELLTQSRDLKEISKKCWQSYDNIKKLVKKKNISIYDIRKDVTQMSQYQKISAIKGFLEKNEVKKALGVENKIWKNFSNEVHQTLKSQTFAASSQSIVKILQAQVKVLIYSGDQDFISNWKGGQKWTNQLEWEKKLQFQMTDYSKWKKYGAFKTVDNFTFMRVFQAGHYVGADQPKAALEMIEKFMYGIPFRDLN